MRWDARVRWQPRRGDLAAQLVAFEQLGIDAGTRVVMPLVDPGFLDSVASAGGRRGFASRLAAVTALLGEIVPATVLERRSKAAFDEVFWGPRARTAAREFDGDGVDPELVDVVALKSIWGGDRPPARTGLLLQQVWLSRMRACG
jgi:asparagine synthase (glutamine-hydrolysing)